MITNIQKLVSASAETLASQPILFGKYNGKNILESDVFHDSDYFLWLFENISETKRAEFSENLEIAYSHKNKYKFNEKGKVFLESEIEKLTPDYFWPYQKGFLKKCLNKKYFGIQAVVGSGKTYMALAYFGLKREKEDRLLVVCRKRIFGTWNQQIKSFYKKWNDRETLILEGSVEERKKQIKETNKKIIITNYEAFTYPSFCEMVKNKKFEFCVLDESHNIKNMKAERTKALIDATEVIPHRILMSGTSITNSEIDMFSQMAVIDRGLSFGGSFYKFKNDYFYTDNFGSIKSLKPEMESKFKEIYAKNWFIVNENEVDLKKPVYMERAIHPPDEVKSLYKKMMNDSLIILNDETIEASIKLAQLSRLRQICSGFCSDQHFNAFKTKAILEEIGEINKPVIIVFQYKEEKKSLIKEMKDTNMNYFCIDGEFKGNLTNEINKMKNGDHQVCLIQPQAAGEGIDGLQHTTNYMLFMSNSYSVAQRSQVEGRINRGGQRNRPVFIDFYSKGFLDEIILRIVRKKITDQKEMLKEIKERLK